MSVLVIEDDAPFLELIRAALEPRKVRFAHTYREAERMIDEMPPKVVLLDLNLPDSSPANTIKRIAEIKKRCPTSTSIIVITGSSEVYRLHNEAVRSGADYVLSKDHGFFDTLPIAVSDVMRRFKCASEETVEQIEQAVAKIVRAKS
jgi:DNA-binding response OmpR family regulator